MSETSTLTSAQNSNKKLILKQVTRDEIQKCRPWFPPLPQNPREKAALLRVCVVSLGMVMFDGHNFLARRPGDLPAIIASLRKYPKPLIDGWLMKISELTNIYLDQLRLVPVYADKAQSRWLWRASQGYQLSHPHWTCFPGTENLGMGEVTAYWVGLQRSLDAMDEFERLWSQTTILAAVVGGEKVHKSLQKMSEARNEFRRNMSASKGQEYVHGVAVNKTAEALVEECERDAKGILDEHDLIVRQNEEERTRRFLAEQERILNEILTQKESGVEDLPAIVANSQVVDLRSLAKREEERKRRLLEDADGPSRFVLDGSRIVQE